MPSVEWAPLRIPLKRRLQTAATAYFIFHFIWLAILLVPNILICLLLFTRFYFIPIIYAAWFAYDFRTSYTGSRWCEWLRNMTLWKLLAEYFPVTLIKTVDLPADKNYLFICHPHGLFGTSFFANFATNATGVHEIFPGLKTHLVSLNHIHLCAIHREMIDGMGVITADANGIRHTLRMGPGHSVCIVVGGVREMLYATKKTMTLVLKNRKGFVKLALKEGVPLVPVIGFGENDLFESIDFKEGTFLRKVQDYIIKMFTYPIPIFYGRGIFQYSFGFVPFRVHLHTVVGKPIPVEKKPEPSQEDIDSLHNKYIEELTALYNEYKAKYGYEDVPLELV